MIEYVDVNRENLEDFSNLILPETLDMMEELDDFDDLGLVLLGAVFEGVPVGASVFQLMDEGGIEILSLFVAPERRNKGIGTELIKRVLSVGLEVFEPEELQEAVQIDIPVRLTVHTEYAIEGEAHETFTRFLKKNGFNEIEEMGRFYTFTKEDFTGTLLKNAVAEDYVSSDTVISLDRAAKGHEDELKEAFEDKGLNPEIRYSFIVGDFNGPDAMLFTEYAGESEFFISSQVYDESLTKEQYLELVRAAVNAVAKDHREFILIAGSEENAFPEIWDELGKVAKTVAKHTSAQMFVEFTEE